MGLIIPALVGIECCPDLVASLGRVNDAKLVAVGRDTFKPLKLTVTTFLIDN